MSRATCFAPYFKLAAKAIALAALGVLALSQRRFEIINVAGVLALAIGIILLLVAVFRYVLDPLEDAARSRSRPTQFTLADFLILVFWLQAPIALIHAKVPAGDGQRTALDCIAWIISTAAWIISVRILSRAGIVVPRHRALFLAVAMPYAYVGTFGLIVSAGMVLATVFNADFRSDLPFHAAWLVAAPIVIAGGLQGTAVFVRRMVIATANADDPPDEANASDDV